MVEFPNIYIFKNWRIFGASLSYEKPSKPRNTLNLLYCAYFSDDNENSINRKPPH